MGGIFLALIVAVTANSVAAQKGQKRSITKIVGDLYRFQNNFHFSVFYVTPGGVLVTDPINAGASKWLKAKHKKRFNQPIKYLVYSHDHQDSSSGGEVFSDTANVLGHELTRAAMAGENRPTAIPMVTFSDTMTLHLGGRQINLIYVGCGHSDNSIVLHFLHEGTVFSVDFVSVKRMSFKNLFDTYIPDLIDQINLILIYSTRPRQDGNPRRCAGSSSVCGGAIRCGAECGPRQQVPRSAKTIDQPAEIRQLEPVQGVAVAQYRRGL